MGGRLLAVAVVAVLAVGLVSCGKESGQSQPAATQKGGAVVSKAQTMCPVMNNPIDKNLYVDVEGKRIYVCCESCIDTIKQDPAKYIKMMESQGIVLDKAPGETK